MTLIDDSTRYCYVYFLSTKYEVYTTLKSIRQKLRINLKRKLSGFGHIVVESTSLMSLILFCAEHGIIHENTPPYSPQSNGVAERKNRTLTDLVNAMLDVSGLSKAWWGRLY